MEISLNHWYARENEFNISLMRFACKVVPVICSDGNIRACIIVKDSDMNEVMCSFDNYERAIEFVEYYVIRCESLDDVTHEYSKYNKLLTLKK